MELETLQGIATYIQKLSKERFYGILELQFQDGEFILLRKQETIKPNFLVVVERRG